MHWRLAKDDDKVARRFRIACDLTDEAGDFGVARSDVHVSKYANHLSTLPQFAPFQR